MTDQEITELCAMAMPHLPKMVKHEGKLRFGYKGCLGPAYDPLHDDKQAMQLVKRFGLNISYHYGKNVARVSDGLSIKTPYRADLNRAICECVAKMVDGNKLGCKRKAA